MEPSVTINGVALNAAQAMALRVAVTSFRSDLLEHGLGEDEHGRAMTALYLLRADEILRAMLPAPGADSPPPAA